MILDHLSLERSLFSSNTLEFSSLHGVPSSGINGGYSTNIGKPSDERTVHLELFDWDYGHHCNGNLRLPAPEAFYFLSFNQLL
jgi:hypothetical protein